MKTQELRLGNLVMSKVNGISKVEQIGSSLNPEYVGGRSLDGNYWENSYIPIPLTKEWLIDFGFEYSGNLFDCDIYKKEIYVVSVIKGECKFSLKEDPKSNYIPLCGVEHIHMLQNLYFALTGEELTIKN